MNSRSALRDLDSGGPTGHHNIPATQPGGPTVPRGLRTRPRDHLNNNTTKDGDA